jgi:hypothetical protein
MVAITTHSPDTGQSAEAEPIYTPPQPRARAQEHLKESLSLLAEALETVRTAHDPAKAAELVGRASDRVGRALYFLRQIAR